MFKRFVQLTAAVAAVAFLVITPMACQTTTTEKPADKPPAPAGQAKPGMEGRRLMQAKPKQQQQQQTPAAPEQQPPAGEVPAAPEEGADEGM
jgi:hypothetical protein